MLNKTKLLYLASYNKETDTGVHFKIEGFVRAVKAHGYEAINPQDTQKLLKKSTVISTLVNTNAKHIVIRSLGVTNLILLPFIIIARIQGKKLYLDIPTPRKAAYYEVMKQRKGYKKITYFILHYLNGPWTMWPYNKVIQYGDESTYFLFWNSKKTIYLGNSIDVNRMALRNKNYIWPDKYLKLIGVGNISDYHGYDRIIKAVYQWNLSPNIKYKVTFTIIGEGDYLGVLKDLVADLNLEKFVRFDGQRNSDYILKVYSESHLAVSSLGLFRINLKTSGVLKAREYCLAGIPFIASGVDVDFPNDLPFRMNVSNDESIDDVLHVFEKFDRVVNTFSDEMIRDYALSNLSFDAQFKKIGILSNAM